MYLIKRYSKSEYLKQKFIALFILNLSDLLFTWLLLFTNKEYFREANFFLDSIIYNIPVSFIVKIGGVAAVILYWNFRIREASEKDIQLSNIGLNICVVLYIIINLFHIMNCFLSLFLNLYLFNKNFY